jgi:predicted dehydrogenase
MVRIGIVGIGFMGRIHFLASQTLNSARVAAICSRDEKKRQGDWSATRGNFGPEPGQVDLTGVKAYATLGEMLADPEIDLIDICNTTTHHPETAIQALEAGKHVLVEKAIALKPKHADRMIAAARDAGKMLMVAHVLPFFPEFRFAAEAVKGGQYGALKAAHFERVIAKPDWSEEMSDSAATGGPAVDLHIHDTHFIAMLCGMPKAVFSAGTLENDAVNYLTTSYLLRNGAAVTCGSGAVAASGRPFMHGFQIYLEKATLAYNSSGLPLTVYGADGSVAVPDLGVPGDPLAAFTMEIQSAVDATRSGTVPDALSATTARNALALCYREIASVKKGKIVKVKKAK